MIKRYYQSMPAGVINIHLIQLFAIFGFAALLGMLNQYLQAQGMSVQKANLLSTSFFALNFLLHFLGGSVGGSFVSYRGLFTWSLLLQMIGLYCLIPNVGTAHTLAALGLPLDALGLILLGMALFMTGSGLNVSCVNMMLTQLFEHGDQRRRVAFSVNYSMMNVGFLVSYLVTNYWQVQKAYGSIFIASIISLSLALISHLTAWRHINDKQTLFVKRFSQMRGWYVIVPVIILACVIMSYYLMHHVTVASVLIDAVFILTLLVMLILAFRQHSYYRRCILVFIIVVAGGMLFAFVQGLQASGLQNFIRFNTNQNLLGWRLSPSGVNSFESLGVIIFGFLLARQLKQWRAHNQMRPSYVLVCWGLLFGALAFLMLPLGIYSASFSPGWHVQVLFPVLLVFLSSAAEVHINTTNYALVGEVAKPQHQGFFTGYLFVNIAVGNQLAGYFSNMLTGNHHHLTHASAASTDPIYLRMFLWLSGVVIGLTIVYALLSWLFKRAGILLAQE